MNRNGILNMAKWCTKLILFLSIAIFVLFIIIFIHWHLNPEFYQKWYLINGFQAGLTSFNVRFPAYIESGLSLAQLSHGMMWWIFIRTSIILVLFWVIINKTLQVLGSIENLHTFYSRNIASFKSLSQVGLVLSVITFWNFGIIDNSIQWSFTIPFGPLLFTLLSLVLSEVFKEGKQLLDDSNSIV